MLISWEYKGENSYKNYNYHIVDSEFECDIVDIGWVAAVITTYEDRNLPVVPNIMKAIMYAWEIRGTMKVFTDCSSLTELTIACKEHCPEKLAPYKKELEKYTVLL